MQKKDKKIKILHLLKSNSFSGAENVAITICKNLSDQYEGAYASPKGEISDWLEKDHITYYPMKKFSVKEFKRIINEFQPDIVHAHDFSASVMAAVCKERYKLISHLHNNPPWIRKKSLKTMVYQICKNRLDNILLVSEAIKKEAVFLNENDKCVQVIGNPIDDKEIQKKAFAFSVEPIDLLFVGRMTEQKNPKLFIDIVENMDKKGQKIIATMVGNGDLYEECKSYMEKLHISDTIKCEGFLENPYPYMKAAKILLVTSKWEGYGLVAREAMVLGTPVIAMDVGGLHEIFENIPEALWQSEEDMKEKVYKLLTDEKAYAAYHKKISNFQKKMMTLKNYLKKLEDIYEEPKQ